MADEPAAEIIIYTQGWTGDHPIEDGEEPVVQIHSRVVINGNEIPAVGGVSVESRGGEFVLATIKVAPGAVKFVPLTAEQFKLPFGELHSEVAHG